MKRRLLFMIYFKKCHTEHKRFNEPVFFFLFNLPTVTARSHIVCPNADLFQKRDPYTVDLRSSKLFLAAYLLDALDLNANICKW